MNTSTDLFEIKQNSFRPESQRSSLQHQSGYSLNQQSIPQSTKTHLKKPSSYARTQNTPLPSPQKRNHKSEHKTFGPINSHSPNRQISRMTIPETRSKHYRANLTSGEPKSEILTQVPIKKRRKPQPLFVAANSGYNPKHPPKYLRITLRRSCLGASPSRL